MSNVTVVITSCDRHDLLRDTLDSFVQVRCGGAQPTRCIIMEDTNVSMPAWLARSLARYVAALGPITWVNQKRRGQVPSIDRAYGMVATDYIFHLEDDWHFHRYDFFLPSLWILEQYPEILQVSLRGGTGWHTLINSPRYPFKIAAPYWGGHWGGFSWNPGLRRLRDYKRIGDYTCYAAPGTCGLVHEALLSKKYLDMGYRIADLGFEIVTHTGDSRSWSAEANRIIPDAA